MCGWWSTSVWWVKPDWVERMELGCRTELAKRLASMHNDDIEIESVGHNFGIQ